MATTKLNLGNLPLRNNDNSGSENAEGDTTNQSIVLPGALGKSNNLGQTNTNRNVAVAPGATATPSTSLSTRGAIKETSGQNSSGPLGTWQGLSYMYDYPEKDETYSFNSYSDTTNNNPTYEELQKALGTTYEIPANADITSPIPQAKAKPTKTGIEALDEANAASNLTQSIASGSTSAWKDLSQNRPDLAREAALEDMKRNENLDSTAISAAKRAFDIAPDKYITYAEQMAEGQTPNIAYQTARDDLLATPLNGHTAEEVALKSQDAVDLLKESAADKEQDLEDLVSQPDSTYSTISYAGYGVDEEAALDEFCNERGLGYVEDNPDRAMMAFQLDGSHDEWHDYVRAYPSLYDSYDEFAYDEDGTPLDIYSMNDALFDVCFDRWWNHYKPITVDQYFDFEDEAGNYTYNGTVTLDTFALCGSSETVMQEWANALAENDWWNSEDLANMVDKYANDESYDFAINSNGSDDLANLEQSNVQAWLLTLFANAEKEATLKAQEATDYRRNPDSPWLGNSTSRGVNVWPEQITGEEGLNNSTYWLNPDMIYLGGVSGDGNISFPDLGISDDYYDTTYLYNSSANEENPDYRMQTGGSTTNEFSPVPWEGPETPTYNNYTMRNSGKAFEGLPYWTSEANRTQNENDLRDIYSYTAPTTYAENPSNYLYYNPYALRDNLAAGQISGTAYDQEEE